MIHIPALLALQALISAIVGAVQERADKGTVAALIGTALAMLFAFLDLQWKIFGRIPKPWPLYLQWTAIFVGSVCAVIAALRMKNRVLGTLMVAGGLTLVLGVLELVDLGTKVRG